MPNEAFNQRPQTTRNVDRRQSELGGRSSGEDPKDEIRLAEGWALKY